MATDKAHIIIAVEYEVIYLQSSCITVNVVLHGLDLNFQGKIFETVSRKRYELVQIAP